jgi:toxin ParE1/3/4
LSSLRFSLLAEEDLDEIGAYTLRKWGPEQAVRYLNDLRACCRNLAANPLVGRQCSEVLPGLCRFEHGKHVVFFRRHADGITIYPAPRRGSSGQAWRG